MEKEISLRRLAIQRAKNQLKAHIFEEAGWRIYVIAFGLSVFVIWQLNPRELVPYFISLIPPVILATIRFLHLVFNRIPQEIFESHRGEIEKLTPLGVEISLEPITYPQPQDNRVYSAVRVFNKNRKKVVVYGVPLSIFHESDGFENDLIDEINYYQSSKLTWRGGDSSGGRKTIEAGKHHDLNIAYVKDNILKFIFRKDHPYDAKKGIYKYLLRLEGKIDDRQIEGILSTGLLDFGEGTLSFTEWKGRGEEIASEVQD